MSKYKLSFFLVVLFIVGNNSIVFGGVKVIFRYDDYGISNDKVSNKVFNCFLQNDIPLLVGVIPFKGKKLGNIKNVLADSLLLQHPLFSIGLHGCTHENLSSFGKSEFYGRPFKEQFKRILDGKNYLEDIFKKNVNVFIPPWNSYDKNTVKVLDSLCFGAISAKRYDLTYFKGCNNIKYIPYTITLKEFVEFYHNKNECKNGLIIVMIHPYDFIENNCVRGSIDLPSFRHLLGQIVMDDCFAFASITDFVSNDEFRFENMWANRIINRAFIHDFIEVKSQYYYNNSRVHTIMLFIGYYMTLFFGVLLIGNRVVKYQNGFMLLMRKHGATVSFLLIVIDILFLFILLQYKIRPLFIDVSVVLFVVNIMIFKGYLRKIFRYNGRKVS